ncbi:SnoaL-like domain-containing protein [Flavobacterium segetis]|uniref:SnoaL-like domain-containing protein n=1 Tax=Flavobacterium segetis TaxID=271157 RepID=A0A1M5F9J7_9FLAO|nr:nuclear transport factor 2 family protein [Flavobacterium segetis]SHF88146.1 SnoaL-like domain-containing protein [Flavobacterium segetis]
MTPEKLQSIAFKWFDTFNNKELEKLLSLYDDEAVISNSQLKSLKPETNSFVSGKQALRQLWQDVFERFPSIHYKVKSVTANGDRVFMEYIISVENAEDMLIAEVLDIKEDKIIGSRVYRG